MPTTARLQKVLSKDHTNGIGMLQKSDGQFTKNGEETMHLLLQTHFPGSRVIGADNAPQRLTTHNRRLNSRARSISGKIFDPQKVKWAVSSFKPYKSPGGDGIFPAMLQKGQDSLVTILVNLFRASYTFRYIPPVWRNVNVVFIPKGGGRPSALPKSYRPISLSSFILKTMEKLVDLHIRSGTLIDSPLHSYQFAYQAGKSTETALHHLVKKIERTYVAKEIAICAFLDVEGAFDNTSYDSIERASNRKGIEPSTIGWIRAMLESRSMTTTLGSKSLTVTAMKGCPQGGVLSPLLWSIVVDELLTELSNHGLEVQGYADDLVVMIRGKCERILTDLMQNALNLVWNWCQKEDLSINPAKSVLVPFTKRRNLDLRSPKLNGTKIKFSTEVKYLGITLDSKLTWNSHLQKVLAKATKAAWACSRLYGRTWGIKPKMIYWSYITVIRPIITYASLVWWPKVEQKTAQKWLQKAQRLACLGVTGAMRTCPTTAIEALINLLPLHLQIKKEAALGALRLQRTINFKPGDLVGHLKILEQTGNSGPKIIKDYMAKTRTIEKPFEVILPERQMWDSGGPQISGESLVWYTDGSKMESGTGAGIHGPNFSLSKAMGHSPSVFQAEAHAIELCVRECLRRNIRRTTIYIMSDSQAVLKALNSDSCDSRLIWDCIGVLKQLAKHNKVILMWVPGHAGIEGNEAADELARKGSEGPFIGPEPFCGTPKSDNLRKLKQWEDRENLANWRKAPGLRQSKRLITPSRRRAADALLLTKKDLRLLTSLLTGHGPWRYHLQKLGKADSSRCRFCTEEVETSEHLLCSCIALARGRLQEFGKLELDPEEIAQIPVQKIVHFAKKYNLEGT